MISIHPTSIIDDGAVIGDGTKIWHFVHVYKTAHIGLGCVLGQNVMIGHNVIVGNNCKIQNNVSLYEGVTLDDDVFCGPSCVFTNVKNPRAAVDRKAEFKRTKVGRGVTIGANATILPGVSIGEYAFIGAGSVVTHDVLSYALVVGNPARQIGWMSESGRRLTDDLICPSTGRRYKVEGGRLIAIF